MRSALVTGIMGQDGYFLTELLLKKGYQVFGFTSSRPSSDIAASLPGPIELLYGDIAHQPDITSIVQQVKPDEIYNLASQSRPGESWLQAGQTLCTNGLGAVYLFEAVRQHCPQSKVYHASSSEMFGQTEMMPQDEKTPLNPSNPYAASKVYAHQMARIYRESYGLFIASGILFNHESERRPLHFVTQKVAYGAACAALGVVDSPDKNERGLPIVAQGKLALGNFAVARDWGYAPDYVRAMWLMLQQKKPEDFVIGTGKLHNLQELCEAAYSAVGQNWQDFVISDPALVRPLETTQTMANFTKAKNLLGWEPEVGFSEMIKKMVQVQIKRLESMRCLGD